MAIDAGLNLQAPQLLTAAHGCGEFDCGEADLNAWLQHRALANQHSGASRTWVVVDTGNRVYGFYALTTGAVEHRVATGHVRRNMPNPVPVLVLGRLGVDRSAQGMHLGAALLRDAVDRTAIVAQQVGVRALVVHALHARAKQFYLHYGFRASPIDPLTLMLPMG